MPVPYLKLDPAITDSHDLGPALVLKLLGGFGELRDVLADPPLGEITVVRFDSGDVLIEGALDLEFVSAMRLAGTMGQRTPAAIMAVAATKRLPYSPCEREVDFTKLVSGSMQKELRNKPVGL